jgi:uncharacterized membrane protein
MNLLPIVVLSVVVLVLDMIYISCVKTLFNKLIKGIQGSDIKLNLGATFLDYILIIFSMYYFIIQKNASIEEAMILGLCIYGIYELTNMAVFKRWTWQVVMIDSIWGAVLYGTSTFLYRQIIQKLM